MNDIILHEKIPKDSFPIRILSYTSLPDDFALHWHEETELLIIQSGEMTLRCGDGIISAKEGDCVTINANELHEGISGKCAFLCLYLPPLLFEDQYYTFKHLINDKLVNDTVFRIYEDRKSVV